MNYPLFGKPAPAVDAFKKIFDMNRLICQRMNCRSRTAWTASSPLDLSIQIMGKIVRLSEKIGTWNDCIPRLRHPENRITHDRYPRSERPEPV